MPDDKKPKLHWKQAISKRIVWLERQPHSNSPKIQREIRRLKRKLIINPEGKNGKEEITHCPKGHPYTKANTYVRASGARVCKLCRKEGVAKRRAELKKLEKRLDGARA